MQVKDLMKTNPQCVTRECSVADAAARMAEVECGVLPVVETSAGSPRAVGVLTDRDIVIRCVVDGSDAKTTKVSDVCTANTVTCTEECDIADAFRTMRSAHVGRLLVTDKDGALRGIVTMADIIANTPREVLDQLPGGERSKPRLHAA